MEPDIIKKTNYTQAVITALLSLVLLGIVGVYIYYGMRHANYVEPVTEVLTEPTVVETHQSLTTKDKLQILNDLAKQAEFSTGTPITIQEKEAILSKLGDEAPAESNITYDDKIKILSALSAPSDSTDSVEIGGTSTTSTAETLQ
jgi:hypothetical protein